MHAADTPPTPTEPSDPAERGIAACLPSSRSPFLFATAFLLVVPTATASPGAQHRLAEVVVRAAPVSPEPRTATIGEALEELPHIELRPQGLGAQTDLSLRGSSFTGAGLTLAGLALRSPQTEHFHLELPLAPEIFSPARTLTGVEQFLSATGHLVGAAALEFAPIEPGLGITLGGGEPHRDWQSGIWRTTASESEPGRIRLGLDVFGGRERRRGDPAAYPENFLEQWTGGLHLQGLSPDVQADFALGRQAKEFGARGFYGAPSKFNAVEELRQVVLVGSVRRNTGPDSFLRLTAVWQRFNDRYVLDRDLPDLYVNRHRSDFGAAAVDGVARPNDAWRVHWRTAIEVERVRSRHEGTVPGTGLGDHDRSRVEAMLMPERLFGPWRAAAGLRIVGFSNDAPALLPAFRLTYRLAPQRTVSFTYSESVRLPSYTELNYDSPGSLGDLGLERQRATAVACIYREEWERASTTFTVFHRRETHPVDWVRDGPGVRWEATDLGKVAVTGCEWAGRVRMTDRLELRGEWSWLGKKTDRDAYAGRYVLDYPRQRVRLSAAWRPRPRCELRIWQEIRRNTANPERGSGGVGTDARIEVRFKLARSKDLDLALAVDNPWASDFEDLPGQPAPGRRISFSLQGRF
ncbi:MAG: TonB-dependent receptor [Kiritimatiellaeota bacterium]|nr:TonB-dependent receptor [Kiritimatiellota bacterium]